MLKGEDGTSTHHFLRMSKKEAPMVPEASAQHPAMSERERNRKCLLRLLQRQHNFPFSVRPQRCHKNLAELCCACTATKSSSASPSSVAAVSRKGARGLPLTGSDATCEAFFMGRSRCRSSIKLLTGELRMDEWMDGWISRATKRRL